MGAHKKLMDLRVLHPQTIEEVANVMLYYPFEFRGQRMRVIPVDENSTTPCISCKFKKQRDLSLRCPMFKACCACNRPDRQSVKFIGDELSSLNADMEAKYEAAMADKESMKK